MADEQEHSNPSTDRDPGSPADSGQKEPSSGRFPVIGVGASAGGLEALKELFENMPGNTGAAFVVVQHLAPSKESAMPELLKRFTPMAVHQATDNLRIARDTIYLIPPDKNMAVFDGTLQLLDPVRSSVIRHPIDFFFKSLALDRGASAVGIILSGTGTDGTEGARAIKAESGLVIAQDPRQAKYDGMPRSVTDAGLADLSLAAAEIPARLVKYLHQMPAAGKEIPDAANDFASALPKILALIRNETGNDFTAYKESTLLRRIRRRMVLCQIEDAAKYVGFLQGNPKEIATLFRELLINVTSFFRDKEAFGALKEVLTETLQNKEAEEDIRVWVVGCATGEEAYSIAILIREMMQEMGKSNQVQVFGTDLDSEAIEEARVGIYRANIADDLTPERLERFFKNVNGSYQVSQEIREMLVFATHNVAKEPPFMKLDLISARNLLIYLKGDLQKKLMPLFHYSLRENGILFLSPSETVGGSTGLFAEIDRKWKIYRCKPVAGGNKVPTFMFRSGQGARSGVPHGEGEQACPDLHEATDRILLSEYAPPYVVIDHADNVVYIRGDVSKYLKLAEGTATMNVIDLAPGGLASPLSMAIRKARKDNAEVRREVGQKSPSNPSVDVLVRPILEKGQPGDHLMVIFKENSSRQVLLQERGGGAQSRQKRTSQSDCYRVELEQELKHAREDLQATIEEMETSNEELKSVNEELLSANEELQSTNEELETSREELRSVNEELTGLNSENQERIEQLSRAQDDMQNLLNTINIATIFLDADLNIQRFTPLAKQLFSIRENDIGRPISEISSALEYDSLVQDVRSVVTNLDKIQRDLKKKDGPWYSLRILPYRNRDGIVSGVLLTFVDIDERRILEAALHYTQSIVDTVREPMLILDNLLCVTSANRSFYQAFRVTPEETLGKYIYELGNRQWEIEKLRTLLENIISQNDFFDNYPVEHDFPFLGRRRMLLNARRLYDELGERRILLAFEDVTTRPNMERFFSGAGPEGAK